MKKMMKVLLLLFIMTSVTMLSCNNEELFVEPVTEIIDEPEDEAEDEAEPEEENETEVNTNEPCDFSLNDVEPNSTVIINCQMDLEGATVTIPENVTILYEGGDIINGTINFSEGNTISGELLNPSITFSGSTPILKDPTFHFNAQRWGIIEGIVSDEIAISNRNIINESINLVKEIGATTFEIDNVDAYFYVGTGDRHDLDATIFIPSNFHFKMGDECNLRVQPNGFSRSVLIYTRSTENVTISGGKLWGDRYTHDYQTESSTHEWGHIIMFRGVHNGVVDGVEMHEGTGDGFEVGGTAHRNNDGSLRPDGRESLNVTVKNCLINDNRRNNISIVDGTNIFIEYNTIQNSGSGVPNLDYVDSNGTSPRAGIDIESFRFNAPDNNSVYETEKTDEIHIRYNTFIDNWSADIAFFNGQNAYAYGNTFTGVVSTSYALNNKIFDNTFINEGEINNSKAISLPVAFWANGEHRITGWEIYGNTIKGYQFGMSIAGENHKIHDNIIEGNQRGIILNQSKGIIYDNNVITSDVSNSFGYYTFSPENTIINTTIKNGNVDVAGLGLFFANKNLNDDGEIIIDNISFSGDIALTNVHGVTIKNSAYSDIIIKDCEPTLINNTNN